VSVTPINTAVSLPLVTPTDDEIRLVNHLIDKLNAYQTANLLKLAYYEGEQRVQMLNISIPPAMQRLEAVVGWPGTVVDVLEERLDWFGWRSEAEDFDLPAIYADNQLALESGQAHLDALIYGTSFVVVGTGDDGEPSPLVTVQSPTTMTGLWNARKRRLDAALSTVWDGGHVVEATLYTENATLTVSRSDVGGFWVVEDRDQHNLGRVPVVQFENRSRKDIVGRSEITKAVRYYTDNAVRTMLGMEINREFYNSPQRYALGVDEGSFTDASGNVRTGWETIMGRVWAIGKDEDGDLPQVGQFTPSSPAPYLEQVKGLAQLIAAEAGLPTTYLGFTTDNPASADAIRAGEVRLIKRAERRQTAFDASWLEVGRLSLLVRDGRVPDDFRSVNAHNWRDAATPTRSAAADEAVKLTSGENPILPPDSSVTYDRIGLSPAEQRQVAADKRRSTGTGVLRALTTQAQAVADRDSTP
jgi:hypothetical protein